MTKTIKITELRKVLKLIGFKVSTQFNTFGNVASIYPIDAPELKGSNVFTKKTLEKYNYSKMHETLKPFKGFNLVNTKGEKIICSYLRD